MKKRYRLYIDESGDHTYNELENDAKRYLGLTGCVIEVEDYRSVFQPAFEALKQKHFPHNPDDPIILHRKELVNREGPFWRLRDIDHEKAFNQDLLHFLIKQEYQVITVVIDKKTHVERYGNAAFHPYHYCLSALLERYCGLLKLFNAHGDVMAESRGGKEDLQLKEAYQTVFNSGTIFRSSGFFEEALTSKEIKVKPKSANIAGLQVSDLLAHPCKQEVLFEEGRVVEGEQRFGVEICKQLKNKYNRHAYSGRVQGYGKVFLK